MQVLKRNVYVLLLTTSSITLTGCMVGPNFHSPPSPCVRSYTEKHLPVKTVSTKGAGKAGHAQFFLKGEDIPHEWWYLFHSRELNYLITMGLCRSPNLAAAYAKLRVAQEALRVDVGNLLFPTIDATASATRQRASLVSEGIQRAPSSVFNVFNVAVNVSYTLDVFGGFRRQVESTAAQLDFEQFELIATQLTLTTDIVTTAVEVASLQAQIETTHELLRSQLAILYILKQQFRLGGISLENVLTQQTLVEQTRATLPPLEKNLAQQKHALSVLIGQYPNEPLPYISLESLNLPQELPLSCPSNLVRQRPDVRAAEAQLHVASANIGVATANLFPQFNITGNYGWTSPTIGGLFSSKSLTWMVTGTLTQPIFHGGALLALRRKAIAEYEQMCAQYSQTVLTAFKNVADTLHALEADAKLLRDQKRAEVSAQQSLLLSQAQYRLGGANYLSLLNAQVQYLNTRLAVIQAKALRYNDTAALFQALGGGWWHKKWCVKECWVI